MLLPLDFQVSSKLLHFQNPYIFKILRFLKFLDFQTSLTFARAYSLKSFKLFFNSQIYFRISSVSTVSNWRRSEFSMLIVGEGFRAECPVLRP